MKNAIFIVLLSIILFFSCSSMKQIGDINMVSSRNIETNMNYVLLRSYMGGTKQEMRSNRHHEIRTLQDAINKVVKETPGGEFLKNVKIYLIDGEYFLVEGDVWGTAGVKENYRGIALNDQVLYKNGKIYKGTIVALKNDKICFFQEFGETKISEIGYDKITRTTFTLKEIEEYVAPKKAEVEKKKEPLIKLFKKS